MAGNEIKLNIKRDQTFDYQPSNPAGYYYLFTGGYAFSSGMITEEPVGDDDGAAGEVKQAEESDRWTIEIEDDTDEHFRIVQWQLCGGDDISGAKFDPPPDTELEPTDKLTIDASDVPAGSDHTYQGYTLTLENQDGERITVDPRRFEENG